MYRLGDKREIPGSAFIWIFLSDVEEAWIQDGRTEEPEEDTGTDQLITDVAAVAASAALQPNGAEHPTKFSAIETNQRRNCKEKLKQKVCIRKINSKIRFYCILCPTNYSRLILITTEKHIHQE